MSGHNKWSKIKHKKSAEDAKKSKVFSELSRNITVESRTSGGNSNSPALRTAIDKARAQNMPSDNIERAIKKGLGGDSGTLEEVLYETYGPGGAAILIEGATDNKNRTSSEIKHTLSKGGFVLSSPGSALWAFEKKDSVWNAKNISSISDNEKDSLKKLVEEIKFHDDIKNVYTNAGI